MGRKLLSGVELVLNWTSLGGALEAALRFLGEPVTTPRVMGVSGLAFRLALLMQADEIAAPGGEAAIDFGRAAGLIRNLGRKLEVIRAHESQPDYRRRRDEAIKRVHKSIDRGVPAIVYDLHLPQFGLVKGYDDRAGVWYVSTVMSAQFSETVPLTRWPVPERPGVVLALLLGDRTRVDHHRAVLQALAFAVAYAQGGDPGDGSGALHGLAAYERWQGAFSRGEPISAPGNASLVQTLQSARRDAAAFLRGDAARLLPDAAGHLARAAAAYDAEALALSRMMTMFPFPGGGDPSSPASRVVAAGSLREALMREHEAMAALRDALHASGENLP
jgi:hypothetical protein